MGFDVGSGVFTIPEASRLLGVQQQKLRRWFSGPHALFQAARWERDVNLTFSDLISALFVNAFRAQGIPMRKIRRAAREAAKRLASERPFALKRFTTDGTTILERVGPDADRPRGRRHQLVDVERQQVVFRKMYEPFLRNVDFGLDDRAIRWWPQGRRSGVVVDPAVALGEPVTEKSRVPTRVLYGAHVAGEKLAAIARWYRVDPREVRSAVRFEERLRAQAA